MRVSSSVFLVLALASCAQRPAPRNGSATRPAAIGCAPSEVADVRTTLYFGLSRPNGPGITESEWLAFLNEEVTPRFPDGLTVWEANGQWRGADGTIVREQTKVLMLIHPPSPEMRAFLEAIVKSYKQKFQQESVLWETAGICAAF